jgi:IS605 OrfB family transposase
LKLDNVREIVIEELKPQVKRIKNYSKDFKNKRQYWVYGKVVKKLELFSQENGILLTKVDPSYTSQQCSKCGSIHKNNRSNEQFLCISCGYEEDADFNAALNLSTMGTYSSHTTIN